MDQLTTADWIAAIIIGSGLLFWGGLWVCTGLVAWWVKREGGQK